MKSPAENPGEEENSICIMLNGINAIRLLIIRNVNGPIRKYSMHPSGVPWILRDGNQALVEPMVVEEKMEMFNLLVKLGFKEIEIGFPAASQIEFDFLRQLVERKMIPDDVQDSGSDPVPGTSFKRTFEAIEGVKNSIVHIYNSTSTLQRDVVFHKSRDEIKQIAVDGVKMVKKYMESHEGNT
jgi:2-isopropylmalate synthase